MHWNKADAQALLTYIEGVEADGLIPKDYRPDELRAAIEGGEGSTLDEVASKSFSWLAEDLRDGRTPMDDRVQSETEPCSSTPAVCRLRAVREQFQGYPKKSCIDRIRLRVVRNH